MPCTYDGSALNGPDAELPPRTRPGAPAVDAPVADGWLLDRLGNRFQLLAINCDVPDTLDVDGIVIEGLRLSATPEIGERYLGGADSAVYLLRPDQHVAARWTAYDEAAVRAALKTATAQEDA